jgi:hypothetical protein
MTDEDDVNVNITVVEETPVNISLVKEVPITMTLGVGVNAPQSFVTLGDTPVSYAGAANELVTVNATEDGLTFTPISDININWGQIEGSIVNQTDLQTALNLKATEADLLAHTGNTSNPHSTTKTQLGLGNVDNTPDINKPISTATQNALNLKFDTSNFSSTFDSNLAVKTTDNLVEGSMNKYDKTVSISYGTGINISGTYPNFTITNSSPDQTVSVIGNTGISVSGTYPSFSITNTEPDQNVTISSGNGITVGGSYPTFTITNSKPDETVVLNAGTGISISGSYPNYTITSTGGTSTGGDVVGPASAVADNFVSFDTTTGKLIKDSGKKASDFAPALGADDNYVTDAQLIVIGNTSGTNTGDNAVNSNYSSLTQYTDEMAQDAVGNAVGNGLDYDDSTGAISVDETELSLPFLKLDQTTPQTVTGDKPIFEKGVKCQYTGKSHYATFRSSAGNKPAFQIAISSNDGSTESDVLGYNTGAMYLYNGTAYTKFTANSTTGNLTLDKEITASNLSGTNTGDNSANTSCLALNQTTPQTVINGAPIFKGGLYIDDTGTYDFANVLGVPAFSGIYYTVPKDTTAGGGVGMALNVNFYPEPFLFSSSYGLGFGVNADARNGGIPNIATGIFGFATVRPEADGEIVSFIQGGFFEGAGGGSGIASVVEGGAFQASLFGTVTSDDEIAAGTFKLYMDAGATANKAYGAHITNVIFGTVTDLAGLVIDDISDGTNNWAIKTGLGKVQFGDILKLTNLKSGTLASPPSGLEIGEVWKDTTTSAQYPIIRIRQS